MSSLSELFDSYSLRARVYPGLLVVLPVTALVTAAWDVAVPTTLVPLLVTAGGPFLLAQLVRSQGRRLESTLVTKWGGMPTTELLRATGKGRQVARERRRKQLSALIKEPLPTAADEIADQASADERYVVYTRALITRVRDKGTEYPRVHEENTTYGFRRNLLALKPLGLALIAASILCDVVAFLLDAGFLALAVALGVQVTMAIVWLRVVTEQWVKEAADLYAERLFESLESLRSSS